jgi:hypothetical protein
LSQIQDKVKRAVGADSLSDKETELLVDAIVAFRAAGIGSVFYPAPIRDAANSLIEIRFYSDQEGQQELAVVRISADGTLLPVEKL